MRGVPDRSVVVIEGILAGRSAILLWMRFLGLGFQGTNQNHPLLARSIWRNLTQSVVKFPPNHPVATDVFLQTAHTRQETATRAETSLRRWWSGAERKTQSWGRSELPLDPCTFQGLRNATFQKNKKTHLTRFDVHSRSLFVSFAAFNPSLKLERTPFKRR